MLFTIRNFDLEKFTSKNCKYIFFLPEICTFRAKILLNIVVGSLYFMFMQMFFSKVHPACHNIVNGIKPGSDSRKTDKHAVDCSEAVCWGVK